MDFYSTLVACRTRLKIKGEEFKDKNHSKNSDFMIGCFPSYPEFSR